MTEVWTVGHSTRPLDQFLDLLAEHRLQALADVRRLPASRRNPQFEGTSLARELASRRVEYRHLEGLGGLRGDYLQHTRTPAFDAAVRELLSTASSRRTAVMCAEAAWDRCHRRFLADVLVQRGAAVHHIIAPGVTAAHVPRGDRRLEEFA